MRFLYIIFIANFILSSHVLDGYTLFTPQVGNPNVDAETKLVINNLNNDGLCENDCEDIIHTWTHEHGLNMDQDNK